MSTPSPIACGVPAGTKIASPASTGMGFSAPSSASWSCSRTQRSSVAAVDVLTPAGRDARVVARGRDDDPRLGLAVWRAQRVAGEGVVRVDVDGQALAGVEQLDEQPRIGAEPRGVLGAEERDGVRGRRVAQQAAVGQAAEAELVVAEDRRRRADPVLGHALAGRRGPAQGGDRGPAEVEARDAVRGQEDGPHGGPSLPPSSTSPSGTAAPRHGGAGGEGERERGENGERSDEERAGHGGPRIPAIPHADARGA